jgi:hypothetical protein
LLLKKGGIILPKRICGVFWGCSCQRLKHRFRAISREYNAPIISDNSNPAMFLVKAQEETAKTIIRATLDIYKKYEELIIYLVAHEECYFIEKHLGKDMKILDLIKSIALEIQNLIQSMAIKKDIKIAPITLYTNTSSFNPEFRRFVETHQPFIILQ